MKADFRAIKAVATALLAGALGFSASSHAVRFEIQNTSSIPNFSASWLHEAESSCDQINGVAETFCKNGPKSAATGWIEIEETTIDMVTGLAVVGGEIRSNLNGVEWILSFDAAKQFVYDNSFVPAGGVDVLLAATYDLSIAGGEVVLPDDTDFGDGTFFFADRQFGSSPLLNSIDLNAGLLYLWGNNWDPNFGPDIGVGEGESYERLGMDLYGVATVVPVPGAIWLFGSMLFGLAAFNSRKRV